MDSVISPQITSTHSRIDEIITSKDGIRNEILKILKNHTLLLNYQNTFIKREKHFQEIIYIQCEMKD